MSDLSDKLEALAKKEAELKTNIYKKYSVPVILMSLAYLFINTGSSIAIGLAIIPHSVVLGILAVMANIFVIRKFLYVPYIQDLADKIDSEYRQELMKLIGEESELIKQIMEQQQANRDSNV
jgi:hypothetical protein